MSTRTQIRRKYSPEVLAIYCRLRAAGWDDVSACRMTGLSRSTILRHVKDKDPAFRGIEVAAAEGRALIAEKTTNTLLAGAADPA
jgi:hypothetical protein